MEIERKWRLTKDQFYDYLRKMNSGIIVKIVDQKYLLITDTHESRIRRTKYIQSGQTRYDLTTKTDVDNSVYPREEHESEIKSETGRVIFDDPSIPCISKLVFVSGNIKLEHYIGRDDIKELYILEIEYPTERDVVNDRDQINFVEVTEDPVYKNKNLCRFGLKS